MGKNRVIPYRVKAILLPVLGVGLMATACGRDEEPINKHSVDVTFDKYSKTDAVVAEVKSKVNQPDVDIVYLVPTGDWGNILSTAISGLRNGALKQCLDIAPGRVCGRGDFNFYPGEASLVPQDSLWYIQNGWTINKDL